MKHVLAIAWLIIVACCVLLVIALNVNFRDKEMWITLGIAVTVASACAITGWAIAEVTR